MSILATIKCSSKHLQCHYYYGAYREWASAGFSMLDSNDSKRIVAFLHFPALFLIVFFFFLCFIILRLSHRNKSRERISIFI